MKLYCALFAAVSLSGCLIENDQNYDGFEADLVIAATSPDYSTSDVALVGNSNEKKNAVIEQIVNTTNPADIRVAAFGDSVYRIGRYGYDNVTKFAWDNDNETLNVDWQYSVSGNDASANPYDMLIVSETSAYITRYDSSKLWHVNPSATTEAGFKLDEIDLSDFANASSGKPFMADLELVDGKLFVMLVRLDDGYVASANSFVAVIDTSDNSIIDTDAVTDGVQAIDLGVRNASNFEKVGSTLYISAVGDAYNYSDTTYKYSGGIVSLNTGTYTAALVLDDGDSTSAPYGNITNVAVDNSGNIYFSGSASYGNDHLYRLEAGKSTPEEVYLGQSQYNISDLGLKGTNLYVGVHAQFDGSENAGLKVVRDNYNYMFIETTYNPAQIFVVE